MKISWEDQAKGVWPYIRALEQSQAAAFFGSGLGWVRLFTLAWLGLIWLGVRGVIRVRALQKGR